MKSKSKYYLGLIILLVGLFLLACFSLIYCSIKGPQTAENKQVEYMMSFAYLLLHILLILGVAFFAIKGYVIRPAIIPVIMTLADGQKNKKSYIICMVFTGIFGILGIFFFLESFQIIHLISSLSLALNIVLMNVGFSVAGVSLYLYFYKPIQKEEL